MTRLLLLLLAAPVLAAPPPEPRSVSTPSLKRVSIGTTELLVRRSLGTPESARALSPDTDLGMGELKELLYSGLTVGLARPPGQSAYTVHTLVVSGGRWSFSNGLRIGLARSKVMSLLGPGEGQDLTGDLVYLLSDRDGRIVLEFVRDRIARITVAEENS